jgi:hypothetical protein
MMSGNIFEPETLLISGIHLVLLGLELYTQLIQI